MKFCSSLILSLFFSVSLSSETVKLTLHTGEILIGELLRDVDNTEGIYSLESKILGQIHIPVDAVQTYSVLSKSVQATGEFLANSTLDSGEESVGVSVGPKLSESVEETKTLSEKPPTKRIQSQAASLIKSVEDLRAPKSWSGNLRLGMNFASGDRDYTQTYLRGRVKVQKAESPHSFELSGEYDFRETEQDTGSTYISDDRYDLEFTYRWLFSKNWFVQNASIFRMNNLKGIDQEIQNLFGLGYRVRFFDSVELLLGSGVGMKRSLYRDLPDNSYFMVNLFQELNWKPTQKIKLYQKINFFQNPEDRDIYNYAFVLSFNYRFTDLLGFEIRYTKDFDNGINDKFNESVRFQNALILYF